MNIKYIVVVLIFFRDFFLFLILTSLTQVGGVVYLISSFLQSRLRNLNVNKWVKKGSFLLSFIGIYSLTTFFIVPLLAEPLGRVPLPVIEKNHLKPLNIWTCFLNRNYVTPELRDAIFDISIKMNDKHNGTVTNYLDANFPFIDKFPLLPHLSHNDGEKLDLSFFYKDSKTAAFSNESPSWIGYGISEEPIKNELNTPLICDNKGYWQYSLLRKIVDQSNKVNFSFDNKRNKDLLILLSSSSQIRKIFIEPHLKTRLNLRSDKIRFHGCQAVRHDDHIHIQL